MAKFTLHALIQAPPETVFSVLTDHASYPSFTPLRSVTLEATGEPERDGVGAIRVLRLAGPPIREQVTEYVRPSRFAYRMLSGAPLRDYVGTVDLSEAGLATRVVYEVRATPTVPGPLAPVVMILARMAISQLLGSIRKRSEQLAARTSA